MFRLEHRPFSFYDPAQRHLCHPQTKPQLIKTVQLTCTVLRLIIYSTSNQHSNSTKGNSCRLVLLILVRIRVNLSRKSELLEFIYREVICMENNEKTIKDDKGKSNSSESSSERSCCYVVDPCVRYVDPCGCFVDSCGCNTSRCCC